MSSRHEHHSGCNHDHDHKDHQEEEEDTFPPNLPASHREAFVAACRGNLTALDSALSRVEINVVDSINASLLHWACFKKQLNVVRYLLERGIDTSLRTSTDSQTALHWACAGGSVHILHLLAQNGINNWMDTDQRGYTALHVASQNGHFPLVHFLCIQDVHVDPLDKENVTPLHWAAIKGHLDIVRYLRQSGADATRQDIRGSTPLHWAVTMGNYSVANYLANEKSLQHLLKVKDNKGMIPKMLAPKDKKLFSHMLLRAEIPRKLSDSSYKFLWFTMPFLFYAIALLGRYYELSFLYVALLLAMFGALNVYVIHPMYLPPRHSNPLIIGIFYSSVSLTFIYWVKYCYQHALDKVGTLYVWFFFAYVATFMTLHVLLVKGDPGILKVSRSNDNKEFLQEIERGIDPAPVCSSCLIRKPVRCKHDAVTNSCVVRFDHYCVWIFNVVGNDNHVKFMIMLSMVCLGHFWTLFHFFPVLFQSLPEAWSWIDLWKVIENDYVLDYVIAFQILNGLWEAALIMNQLQMITSNMTVNDVMHWKHYSHFWKNGDSSEFYNPFDRGLTGNIKQWFFQGRTKEWNRLYHMPKQQKEV